ncbi:hypothetical protein [Microbacterium thalassium]|uniref:O-antigen/teichoic acid export membrane protein n=1 Tax=Microbacterium thalassium TaxID=362649 RepID=A0A7X0KUF5_9MICO|nr:hypothetical protein [Microbacterium thalassium]MBB6391069.1 O-antigen/teichoic acid export membrane protein [Microbacterium thalassium]
MDKQDYALYAIALSALGLVTTLSDAGVNSKLLALAGEGAAAGKDVSPYFRAAMQFRRILAAAVVLPGLVLAIYLLFANGASPLILALSVLAIALTALAAISTSLVTVALQVFREYKSLQGTALWSAIVRLGLVAALFLLGVSSPPAFLFAGAIAAAYLYLARSRTAKHHADWGAGTHPVGREDFISASRSALPSALALILAEQLVTILLTINGNTDAIAEIAALTRFAVAFAVVNDVVRNIVAPSIARSAPTRSSVLRSLGQVSSVYLLLAVAYLTGLILAGPLLLSILGPEYAGLTPELAALGLGTVIVNFSRGGIGAINYARGWNRYSWSYIPFAVVWAIVGLSALDLSTTWGAIAFSASLALVGLASQVVRLVHGVLNLESGS